MIEYARELEKKGKKIIYLNIGDPGKFDFDTPEHVKQALFQSVKEGLTTKQIAEKLDRSEAGIRNLCYRKRLIRKAEDETQVLFSQRDQLKDSLATLQGRKTLLNHQEIEGLKKEREKFEAIIYADKALLEQTLSQALVSLKQQRPDLFTLTGQDQILALTKLFFRFVT